MKQSISYSNIVTQVKETRYIYSVFVAAIHSIHHDKGAFWENICKTGIFPKRPTAANIKIIRNIRNIIFVKRDLFALGLCYGTVLVIIGYLVDFHRQRYQSQCWLLYQQFWPFLTKMICFKVFIISWTPLVRLIAHCYEWYYRRLSIFKPSLDTSKVRQKKIDEGERKTTTNSYCKPLCALYFSGVL